MGWWTEKLTGAPPTRGGPAPRSFSQIERAVTRKGSYEEAQLPCPGCGGPNYGGGGAGKPRCFDCGYPLIQSGSGLSGSTPVRGKSPAKQVPVDDYKPNVIVGRL